METLKAPKARAVLIALALVVFAAHAALFRKAFIDDAYITFRYAKNLAEGLGFVYNAGERVEGTSSFLWTLWITLGMKIGFDPLFFAKISGFGLGASLLIYVSVRFHGLIALLAACSGAFVYWCMVGMETPLFSFALAIAVGELYFGNLIVAAIFFGLLPTIRPDGLYFIGLVLMPELMLHRFRGVIILRRIGAIAALALTPLLCLSLWRYLYFGHFQPNTYFAKVSFPSYLGFWQQLEQQGIPYVISFWKTFPVLFFGWTAALVFSIWHAIRAKSFFLLQLNLALIFYQAYFVFIGGDWMPEFRWYAALIPIFLGLSTSIFSLRFTGHFERWRPIAVALSVLALGFSFLDQSASTFIGAGLLRYNEKHDLFLQALGRQMRIEDPFDQTIFLGDIGAIGYESEMKILDGGGLVDAHIAKIPAIHFWKTDIDYFFQQNPEWAILRMHFYFNNADAETQKLFRQTISEQPEHNNFTSELWRKLAPSGRWNFEQQLLASPEFHARYGTVFVSPEFDQPQFLILFCRADICDSEMAARLRQWAPNLGHVKSEFNRADSDYFLRRTTEIIPHEESATFVLASRTSDKAALRKLGSDWLLPAALRIDAYSKLGLIEYYAKEYNAALEDFQAVVKLGTKTPEHYANLAWAFKALGKEQDAARWFERAKQTR